MTAEHLHILQHSLGVDSYGRGPRYRNHYCAGGSDIEKCRELVGLGFMQEQSGSALTGGDPLFTVTRDGIEAVAEQSPAPPKLTRGQRRYRAYLRADFGMSFGDWLRHETKYRRTYA